MPRIGIHKLIESHTISCFSKRMSFRETTDTFFKMLSKLDEERAFNNAFFTNEYCYKQITIQYNKCKTHKHFRGDSVKESIYALFKRNYSKYGKNWAYLPQSKIAKDLGVCTKTIQRALNQMKKDGLIVLEKKWSSFRHLAAEYTLTAKGMMEGKIITSTVQKVKNVYEKYSKHLIERVIDVMKNGLGRESYFFKDTPPIEQAMYNRILDDLIRTGELTEQPEMT